MIKPITFQGVVNFKASLYALEIKSRFIDQANANGYFKNYGQELALVNSSPTTITIGTGAFCVQGRMSEVTSQEVLNIDYSSNISNNVGYVIAKIQTYQLNSENNCSLLVRLGSSFNSIDSTLTQEDTYAYDADANNKIYELPIYSFEINQSTGELTNVTKLIQPISDYDKVYNLMLSIQALATSIEEVANESLQKSTNAESMAEDANEIALTAGENSLTAKNDAENAVSVANNAMLVANNAKAKVDELGDQVVQKQGTKVLKNGVYLTNYETEYNLTTNDIIRIKGGNSVKE